MASVEGEEIGSPEVFQTFSGTVGIETTAMDAINGCAVHALCGWYCPPVLCVALLAMLYMIAFRITVLVLKFLPINPSNVCGCVLKAFYHHLLC